MYLKISAMNEFFNPKVGLRALFSDPHWLAPYPAGGGGDSVKLNWGTRFCAL